MFFVEIAKIKKEYPDDWKELIKTMKRQVIDLLRKDVTKLLIELRPNDKQHTTHSSSYSNFAMGSGRMEQKSIRALYEELSDVDE